MATLDFRPSPRDWPAPWTTLDVGIARWVGAHGGPPSLALAAGWASCAARQGDSALMLQANHAQRLGMDNLDALAQTLSVLADQPGNGWLARPDGKDDIPDTPFVLDGPAFYLRRHFIDEWTVARALRDRLMPASPAQSSEVAVETLFSGDPRAELAQRQAVAAGQAGRLFVLTGGPGTGKTATVLRLLLARIRRFRLEHDRDPILRLAAPTGKAAQRLAQSLQDGAHRLPPGWASESSLALASEPTTLHRMLGSRGLRGGFHHHADEPIQADLVVVDEASMVDLGLLRVLLDALAPPTALILVGDADQLAPVGTGSALSDLVGALAQQPGLARLSHSFRANQALVRVNEAVRQGDVAALHAAIEHSGARVRWCALPDPRALSRHLAAWAGNLHRALSDTGALEPVAEDDPDALARSLAVLRQSQLLCALREGVYGADEVAGGIEQHLRALGGTPADARWYPGRAVIVTRNDPAAGLWNGDVGMCLQLRRGDGTTRLAVAFETGPGLTPRVFEPDALPFCECAWALTVHKSQGSEYNRVAILLPPLESHPLLVRQMLYTAASRARDALELWAEPASVAACLATPLWRAGRLGERLASRHPAPATPPAPGSRAQS